MIQFTGVLGVLHKERESVVSDHLKNERQAGRDWRAQQKKNLPLFAPALFTVRFTACRIEAIRVSNDASVKAGWCVQQ